MQEHTFNALEWIVRIFEKHNTPYQISGGLAAKLYGSKRPLNDIDFDIPENRFVELINDIREYIIWGPGQYKDEKWDCYLVTLNYNGQEIDLCGANHTKITVKDRSKWVSLYTNLDHCLILKLGELNIRVIHPKDLINYKSELDGKHQFTDVESATKFLYKTGKNHLDLAPIVLKTLSQKVRIKE